MTIYIEMAPSNRAVCRFKGCREHISKGDPRIVEQDSIWYGEKAYYHIYCWVLERREFVEQLMMTLRAAQMQVLLDMLQSSKRGGDKTDESNT